jgi:Spondin_N
MRTEEPQRFRVAALVLLLVLLLLGRADAGVSEGRYELIIANTNQGQNFSPPVIILHRPDFRLFELEAPASTELWLLAEDGLTAAFEALPATVPSVPKAVVAERVHRQESPVVTARFEAQSDLLVSVAAMLSLTNDGFVAARSIPLPQQVGASARVPLRAYDAGSEANTESCAHVPCKVHGRRMTNGAEGVVREHPGIRGDVDISLRRRWEGPEPGYVTITRLH